MFKNFFLITVRIFFREQRYAIINISGLVVGLISSIFIFLWIIDEITYDQFHKNHDRIFEVMENQYYSDGKIITYEGSPAPLAEKLRHDFPEIEQSCHITWNQRLLFSNAQQSIYEEGLYADSSFFRLFTFPLLEGNASHLLSDNNSVVISRKMAEKFFKGQSALGRILHIDKSLDVKVTGVVENIPSNSSITFDFILPFELYSKKSSNPLDWTSHVTSTYVKLQSKTQAGSLNSKIKDLLLPTNKDGENIQLFLFPLKDWRLHWHFENGKQVGGRISYVVAFGLVALFIQIAACINFMNLATARAAKRAREVGIRKVAGASRSLLIKQFMFESLSLSILSLFIALLGIHLLTPLFNLIAHKKDLSIDYTDPYIISGLLGITLFSGLLAGSYPAFFLSSFRPASILKGNLLSTRKGAGLRKALVFFQFGLAMILVVGAFVVNDQVQYILNKNMGYDKENVLYFEPPAEGLKNLAGFKDALLQNAEIEFVGGGFDEPMNIFNNDVASWEGVPANQDITVQTTECDPDYLKALGVTLLSGRHFSPLLTSDSSSFIVNEACAKLMGFKNPVGHKMRVYKTEGNIIGVVKNFHNRDLYSTIDPVIFVLGQARKKPMNIFVRYKPGQTRKAIEIVKNTYIKFEPDFPLEISFLDKTLERMYWKEIMTGHLSLCFTIIIIFISCLGLFGLTLFTTERRTKEIGIRKVLGASTTGLIILLCKDFTRPVLLSLLVSYPIAFYLSNQFLNRYQFHTDLNTMIFLLTGASVIVLSILTVLYQSRKAALTNPAETLRAE